MRRHARNSVAPRLDKTWVKGTSALGRVRAGRSVPGNGTGSHEARRNRPWLLQRLWGGMAFRLALILDRLVHPSAANNTSQTSTPTGRKTSLNPNGLIAGMDGKPFRNVSTAQSKLRSASKGPNHAAVLGWPRSPVAHGTRPPLAVPAWQAVIRCPFGNGSRRGSILEKGPATRSWHVSGRAPSVGTSPAP